MELPVIEAALDLPTSATLLLATVAGAGLGIVSGLIPGLHANNFALLLAGLAPSVPADPLVVGAAMLAAGVVHTFVDVVPALAIGVPDADAAVTALPGHRLVLEGRGREAMRLSALGSVLAVAFAVPLAVPLTAAVVAVYDPLMASIELVLVAVVAGLVASEGSRRAALGAVVSFALVTALGLATLDLEPAAPLAVGGMLSPLFAGLFGAPTLLEAANGRGPPAQAGPTLRTGWRPIALTAGAGALSGAVVGFLPGISAAIAAVAVLAIVPNAGDRGYVVATSGVDTANAIFALFALAALDKPRSGVVVAYQELGAPVDLGALVPVTLVAGAVGYFAVVGLGDRVLEAVDRVDYVRLCLGLLVGLAGLSFLFAGPLGVAVYAASAAIGLVPLRTGARRVHLMGVLIGPMLLR
ncbi:MAG: tripartite tricarboxylate transporter permease [Halobacteriales archaeon]